MKINPVLKNEGDFFEDLTDHAIIGPHDNRIHTVDTRRFPFNTVCHLIRDFGDGRLLGASGILISPKILLTAAHCLYKPHLGRGPVKMYAIPGRSDRDTMPFSRVMARRFHVPVNYIQSIGLKKRRYDYGVVVLQQPVKKITRFIPMRLYTKTQLHRIAKEKPITICGYPGDKPVGTQWHHQEFLKKATPTRFFYTTDTCPGHSGAPIWLTHDHKCFLIGIHTTGVTDEQGHPYGCSKGTVLAPPDGLNSGIRFNEQVLIDIQAAIKNKLGRMKRFDL